MEGKNGDGSGTKAGKRNPKGERSGVEGGETLTQEGKHTVVHTEQHTTTATASPHAINRRALEQANDVQRRGLLAPTLIVEQVHIPRDGRLGRITSPRH